MVVVCDSLFVVVVCGCGRLWWWWCVWWWFVVVVVCGGGLWLWW